MSAWGLDLGTTNTGLARWDAEARRPTLVALPGLSRLAEEGDALLAPRLVPSATEMVAPDTWARLGRPFGALWGREAHIGRAALHRNTAWPSPAFTPTFKAQLARDPLRPLARLGAEPIAARAVARAFCRELLREAAATTGERVRDLAITVPVAAYDGYRAELAAMARAAGVRRVRFLDEPVAAAVGYGLSLDRPRDVLVLDLGGGTLHAALVGVTARAAEAGRCEVRGKEGRAVGGNLVDRWLLEDVCAELGVRLDEAPAEEAEGLWQRLMLAEARRVKEAVHFRDAETLTLTAPEELRGVRARLGDRAPSVVVTRARLEALLERRGLFGAIAEAVDTALGGATPDEVLLIGGSTLLPGVFPRMEARFGRDRVRGWSPFEAVALGAATFAGGDWISSDHLVHDYALLTHDLATQAPQHAVIVPRGTRFPTPPDLWSRAIVPTCALGEPESLFRLVVVEIGRHGDDARRFGWDASGNLRPLSGPGAVDIVVPLNANNPTLGRLDPPHEPGDRRPRLQLSFGVDADRWLIATVTDLRTRRVLMKAEPVVRLV